MEDLSEVRKLQEKKDKRNMDQLENVMESIAGYIRKSLKNATLRNLNSLELNINLDFKESFDSHYIQFYESTKAYGAFLDECDRNDVRLTMKLKGTSMLMIKAKW